MADFITTKANGDTLDASEWNQLAEIDNAIDSSGLTLTTAQTDQLKISMSRYSSGADFYTDGGSANAYVLTSISHGGGKSFAPAGSGAVNYFNGMRVRFRPANNNSGASTINVSSFGLKDIRKSNGTTALSGGELTTTRDVILRYDSTNNCFIIQEYDIATTTNQGVSYLNNPITIANNATTPNTKIDFPAGVMTFDDGSGQINSSAMTGDLANTFGTSDGMLDTGTKANTSDYSLFAIYNPTTGVIKPLASLSRTAPTMPSGYTKKDYRGKILTDASGNIIAFLQYKDRFEIIGTYPFKQFPANTTTFTDISFATNYVKEVRQNINVRIKATEAITTSLLYIRDKFSSDSKIISTGEENSGGVNIYSYLPIDIVSNSAGIWQYKTAAANSYVVATNDGFYLTGWIDYNLKI
jgi:hypothetical protein